MGSALSRREMLRLALMSSENRAASSLARHYPGGTRAFVDAMNFKAASLGLTHTHYSDPTGLSAENVSTAKDLGELVQAAAEYPLIRDFTTTPSHFVEVGSTGQTLGFNNSERAREELRRGTSSCRRRATSAKPASASSCSSTSRASRSSSCCSIRSAKYTRIADAQRVKHWLETGESLVIAEPKSRLSKTGQRVHGSFEPRIVKTSTRKR